MSWFTGWFGYGLGAGAAKAILGEPKAAPDEPVPQQTEAQIRADEVRYDEEARRLAAEDAAAKKDAKTGRSPEAGAPARLLLTPDP